MPDSGTTPSDDATANFDATTSPSDAEAGTQRDSTTWVVVTDGAPVTSVAIAPANQTVIVKVADGVVTQAPTVQFSATDSSDASVNVGWTIDQGALGSISTTGLFIPSGTVGGTANIIAGFGSSTARTTVTVIIQRTQNGNTGTVDLSGAGGYAGVGGEGPGGPASAADVATLQQTPTADSTLSFLYPYDGTVWPRGLLAPLLQWTEGPVAATAIELHLQSKTFAYDGTFGRPAALAAGAPFVRHPIPQDVWQQAVESTAGTDTLQVSLVLASAGAAIGPISETWKIAPGILEGTIYYESYGTNLVLNSDFNVDGGHVGAAVLGIKPGDTAPHIVAGTNSPTNDAGVTVWGEGCRGCHSVAAKGGSLIVQDTVYPYPTTSLYNLTSQAETILTTQSQLKFASLSPEGAYALTNSVNMASDTDTPTELYQIGPPATVVTDAGLPPNLLAATPTFSPNEAHVAFTLVNGTLGTVVGDGKHVVTMDFDPTGPSFANAKNVFDLAAVQPGATDGGTDGGRSDGGSADCVGYPSFMPTNDAIVVQVQLSACGSATYNPYIGTGNVRSELWWADVATGTPHRLDALNGYNTDGTMYLPKGPNNHANDATLNYQPGVNPAPSGGYAWVIFTSRRLYGNVATIDPFQSDPRSYDYVHETTTKKLWVAAIDLNAPVGTDPSHPAFYLPAQELRTGNARGNWVLDPCKADGLACTSGDQCCGGFCQESPGDAGLTCISQISTCAQIGDKCSAASDCCDPGAQCIDSVCAYVTPISTCVQSGGACTTALDCCDTTEQCINSICAVPVPPPACVPTGDACTTSSDCCDPTAQCIDSICKKQPR
jgi:hypothetical protein